MDGLGWSGALGRRWKEIVLVLKVAVRGPLRPIFGRIRILTGVQARLRQRELTRPRVTGTCLADAWQATLMASGSGDQVL